MAEHSSFSQAGPFASLVQLLQFLSHPVLKTSRGCGSKGWESQGSHLLGRTSGHQVEGSTLQGSANTQSLPDWVSVSYTASGNSGSAGVWHMVLQPHGFSNDGHVHLPGSSPAPDNPLAAPCASAQVPAMLGIWLLCVLLKHEGALCAYPSWGPLTPALVFQGSICMEMHRDVLIGWCSCVCTEVSLAP